MPMFKVVVEDAQGARFKVVNSVNLNNIIKLCNDLIYAYPAYRFSILDDHGCIIWPNKG